MSTLWQDVKFATRMLSRSRGFAFLAILTLALGIAGTCTIFGVVRAVLLHSLPFANADRLVIFRELKVEDGEPKEMPFSYQDFEDLSRNIRGVERLASYIGSASLRLESAGKVQRMRAELVSGGYFSVLGIDAVVGRTFTPEEISVSADIPVVLLSDRLWKSQFGASHDLIGSTIVLNGQGHRVLGILPPSFLGLSDQADLWLPMGKAAKLLDARIFERRGTRLLSVVGRLRPGVSLQQAEQSAAVVAAALEDEYPDTNRAVQVRVETLAEAWFGDLRVSLLVLLAGSFIVLLISCANVANLLLVRAVARSREYAIRSALGASSRRIVQQLLTESLLLAALGSILGILLAYAITRWLLAVSPVQFPSFVRVTFDPLVVGGTLLLALICGIAFGLSPAWIIAKTSLRETLAAGSKGSTGSGRTRLQELFVLTEMALAVVLLVGAGLVVRSFLALQNTDLGFNSQGLLTLRLDAQGDRYATPETLTSLGSRILERLRQIPGVETVAIAGPDLPTDNTYGAYFRLEDRPDVAEGGAVPLAFHHVSPGYFKTLGIPLLQGQDFDRRSRMDQPLEVIVSEEMIRRYWPAQNPIGKRIQFKRSAPTEPWFTVVGVAGDAVHQGFRIEEWSVPHVYFSWLQIPPTVVPTLNVMLRARRGPASALVPQIISAAYEVAPDLPVYDIALMEERLSRQMSGAELLLVLLGGFSGLSLILAAVGTYGVISYTVRQRTHEISIHMALGAEKWKVLGMVLQRSAALALGGLAVGLLAAFLVTPLFQNRLYQVASHDPLTFVIVSTVLFFVALAASLVPAWRAMRIQPINVLRG